MSFAKKFAKPGVSGSFTSELIRQRAMVYFLRLNHEKGGWAWYIFEADSAKNKAFRSLLEDDESRYDLLDYGTVHASGWGKEPPESIKMQMREKYGLFGED